MSELDRIQDLAKILFANVFPLSKDSIKAKRREETLVFLDQRD